MPFNIVAQFYGSITLKNSALGGLLAASGNCWHNKDNLLKNTRQQSVVVNATMDHEISFNRK